MPGNTKNRPNTKLDLAQRRAAIARAARGSDENAALIERREYAAAKLEDYIKRVVADAPPLTLEQRGRLAGLFSPARRSGGSDAA